MTISQKGIDLIKGFEGCVLHAYLDIASVPTIGWGSTRYEFGGIVKMTDPPITQEHADELFWITLQGFSKEVDAMVTDRVNQNNFDALVSLAYNIGSPSFKTSTVRRLVNANPNNLAIRAAFMMWDKVHVDGVLRVSDTLFKRRRRESDYYFS